MQEAVVALKVRPLELQPAINALDPSPEVCSVIEFHYRLPSATFCFFSPALHGFTGSPEASVAAALLLPIALSIRHTLNF